VRVENNLTQEVISSIVSEEQSYLDLKVALVMPVYNEGETIQNTVLEIEDKVLSKMPNASLFISEDGSKDNTKEVLTSLSNPHRKIFAKMTTDRKGYPKAVKDALMSVDESQFDYVLFLDSDGQYDPDDFMKLFEAIEKEPVDIVMGQRRNRSEPFYRVALSSGLKILEKVLFAVPCKDVTSALRLIRVGVAKKIASEIKYSRYSFWLEFTARATEEGYSMLEVPVDYRARAGEAKSNVYSLRKMPKVVSKELSAIFHTWWEYKGVQALKFGSIGLTGAAVILALSYLLTTIMHENYLFATGIAIEASIVWAFVLNDRLTFTENRRSFGFTQRLGRYNFVALGGFTINETLLFSFTHYAGVYYLASEFIAIVITFGFNYFASLKWAWVREK
jgi:putative flippase GtrA